jgi:predicted transcriptional regulator
MTPAQCRAARAFLGMPRPELAKASIVPTEMIADFEAGIRKPTRADVQAMQWALEAAGVEFIQNGVKSAMNSTLASSRVSRMTLMSSSPRCPCSAS